MDSSPRLCLPPSWLGPVLVSAFLNLALIALYLIPYHGDLSALVCVPERWLGQWPFEAVRVVLSPQGYDGAFYYAIARNPFDIPVSFIDDPGVRHGRLLYPLLAWLLSGGDAERLFWAMPLLNLVAIMMLTWLGARIAAHFGRSGWWGLLLSVGVNAFLPALRDLTDPLAATTAVGLIASWLLRWPTWTLIAWGVAAVLSREQNIVIVMIVGLDALRQRDFPRAAGIGLIAAIWVGWLLILKGCYGAWPIASYNTASPLTGICHAWAHLGQSSGGNFPLDFAKMASLTAMLLAAPIVIWRGSLVAKLITVAGAMLAILGGTSIYSDPWSYTRVLNWLPLGIWLYGVQNGKRWPILLLAPAALWPMLEVILSLRARGVI
jgi:hypothetical protein